MLPNDVLQNHLYKIVANIVVQVLDCINIFILYPLVVILFSIENHYLSKTLFTYVDDL